MNSDLDMDKAVFEDEVDGTESQYIQPDPVPPMNFQNPEYFDGMNGSMPVKVKAPRSLQKDYYNDIQPNQRQNGQEKRPLMMEEELNSETQV